MKLEEATRINPNAILIHSGILFDVFNPKIEDIDINDIAHALSNICRYGGHSPKFYLTERKTHPSERGWDVSDH
ncbi:MAG: hypothetical protein KatS3mg035_1118 [Bacteroidia bacterium]|nr:MAG: hypothetical protein KatS3mg035_1118 [Bacteroidia bacterium]